MYEASSYNIYIFIFFTFHFSHWSHIQVRVLLDFEKESNEKYNLMKVVEKKREDILSEFLYL